MQATTISPLASQITRITTLQYWVVLHADSKYRGQRPVSENRKHKTNKEKQNKKLGTSEFKTSTLSKSNSMFLLGYTSVLMTNT